MIAEHGGRKQEQNCPTQNRGCQMPAQHLEEQNQSQEEHHYVEIGSERHAMTEQLPQLV
jgi:hypothetical protein